MKIFSRAKDADHAERLQRTLDIIAMVPIVPEDNLILTLPFGGAVLRSLGAAQEEVNAILEGKRKELLSGRGFGDDEQNLILAQLGIKPPSNSDSQSSAVLDVEVEADSKEEMETSEIDSSKSQDASTVDVEEDTAISPAAKAAPKPTPMVAEVIAATTGQSNEVVETTSNLDEVELEEGDTSIKV